MRVNFSKSIGHYNCLMFYCPGCKRMHYIPINGIKGNILVPTYDFNHDFDNPTIIPEINDPRHICSYSIKDGRITYNEDCIHPLAGKSFHLYDLSLNKYWIYRDIFNVIKCRLPLHANYNTKLLIGNTDTQETFIDRLDMFFILDKITYNYGIVLSDDELDDCHKLFDIIKLVYHKMIE